LIYTIDKDDDWKDFAVWKKANPNFGISCLEDDLRSKYRDAMQLAHKQNINKCKHLNIWSNAAISWINMVKLDECIDATITPDKFKDCPCWVGLDLASRIDLTAMMLVFRLPEENSFSQFTGGRYAIFGKFYLPSETVELSENGHYRAWEAQGFLKSTPGHRIDLGYVMQDLQEIAKTYNVKELVYDPYEATRFIEEAQNVVSFPCIEMLQTPNFMSEPMKIFEEAYMSGNLLWDGNSFLRWQFSNVILKNAANKKYYPTKEKGNLKIDGPVATLMALSRASLIENAASVYETRGEFLWL
ncbi:MAG: terminase large subunit, partial [Desulfovibrio sp.]|nr:terminase large subunit [Desulfovibrio sp.]